MRVSIGSDHRGYGLKSRIAQSLKELGHDVVDEGTDGAESVDYPDFAAAVARGVSNGDVQRGILICGTGIGMCITANKLPGVRAATCHDEVTAELSRRHNDLNVLCLSADLMGQRNAERVVQVWMETEFDGGRHQRRLDKIAALESGDSREADGK